MNSNVNFVFAWFDAKSDLYAVATVNFLDQIKPIFHALYIYAPCKNTRFATLFFVLCYLGDVHPKR